MERYIDAEKIKYHKLSVCEGHGLNFEYTVAYKHEVDAIPTADVVPKSEVERLTIDMNAARLGMIVEHERLKTAKADVAREIFADIEREIKNHGITYAQRKIAELKKKYTEER